MATDTVSLSPYKKLPYDDQKRFVCVYPAYLNAKKTLVNGRRIPKSKAVDNPTCLEMRDVCTSLGLNCYLEAKHYPREPIKDQLHGGRLRVQLMAVDGTPVLENITSRRELLLMLSEVIPKLKTRQGGKSTEGGVTGGGQSSGASKKKKKRK
ncbi:signal recognition particle 19 kDa protein-like [Halichondria panicea]|uniref:signal recognition particle 19 kDa protein-like n=1 Tax=Halichondria panicea TaxID=6063 RepID=UPI00312B4D18